MNIHGNEIVASYDVTAKAFRELIACVHRKLESKRRHNYDATATCPSVQPLTWQRSSDRHCFCQYLFYF